MENLDIILEGYNTLLLQVELAFFTHPFFQQTKLRHLFFLVSKVSRSLLNIWIFTHMNPHYTLIILMMAQMSSDLPEVGIKFKTTQPRIFQNAIKMWILIELSTEGGQFQVFFILSLVFLDSRKYRLNQLQPMTQLMQKIYSFTSLSRELRLSGETWNHQHSTLLHPQYIWQSCISVVESKRVTFGV